MKLKLTWIILFALLAQVVPAQAALLFYWPTEGTDLTVSGNYTAGTDTSVASTGAPEISSTSPLVGSNSVLIDAGTEYYSLNAESAGINIGAGAVGMYFNITTFADGAVMATWRTNSGAANDYFRISMSTVTNNHIRLNFRTSAGGSQTFDCSTAVSTSTTYFLLFKWDQSASDRRCEIYDSGGTEVGSNEDLSTGWTSPATSYPITDGITFGEVSGTGTNYKLDNIFFASTMADGATIYCNRDITTYTSYAACGGAAVNFFPRRLQVNP